MKNVKITAGSPHKKLDAFDTYDDFLTYTQKLFDLKPEEYQSLFNVLIKLQSVGIDPLQAMHECKSNLAGTECLDMLKFMMYIDGLDLEQIKEMA